ncbi:Uncharacterised protein [Morganella morganii]|nr:Uncharacterised protein [Morganella morganii]
MLGGGNNTIALSGNTSDIATGHGDNTIEMLGKAVTGILTAGNGNKYRDTERRYQITDRYCR